MSAAASTGFNISTTLLSWYYYAGVPVLTFNMLMYSLNTISTSITSSRNVLHFITDAKVCDKHTFMSAMAESDLIVRMQVAHGIVLELIRKKCKNDQEFSRIKQFFEQPEREDFMVCEKDANDEFCTIEMKENIPFFDRLLYTEKKLFFAVEDIIREIEDHLDVIDAKIQAHDRAFLGKVTTLSLFHEIQTLERLAALFEKRFMLLLQWRECRGF